MFYYRLKSSKAIGARNERASEKNKIYMSIKKKKLKNIVDRNLCRAKIVLASRQNRHFRSFFVTLICFKIYKEKGYNLNRIFIASKKGKKVEKEKSIRTFPKRFITGFLFHIVETRF